MGNFRKDCQKERNWKSFRKFKETMNVELCMLVVIVLGPFATKDDLAYLRHIQFQKQLSPTRFHMQPKIRILFYFLLRSRAKLFLATPLTFFPKPSTSKNS